jgi:hypothetical protein
VLQEYASFVPKESQHNLPCRWMRTELFIALVTCLPTYRAMARYFEFLSQFYVFHLTDARSYTRAYNKVRFQDLSSNAACFILISCFEYSSILKMEAICFSEKLVYFHRNTRHYILEDRPLHNHRCDNLKSSI